MKRSFVVIGLRIAILSVIFFSCQKEGLREIVETSGSLESSKAQEVNLVAQASITYPVETLPMVYTKRPRRAGSLCGGYWEALPASYNAANNKLKYPLILNFTGDSQLGDGSSADLDKQNGPIHQYLLANNPFLRNFNVDGKNFSYIIIVPQFSTRPNADQINEVLNFMLANYRIDQSRIYITGHSLGGGLCWDYAGKYGNRIAAMVPVCGASEFSAVKAKVIANNKVPTFAFHNLWDHRVDPQRSVQYVNAINNFSRAINPPLAKLQMWDFPERKHDAWSNAYTPSFRDTIGPNPSNKNVYQWLLQYKR